LNDSKTLTIKPIIFEESMEYTLTQ
jgi:hypothetical protein